MSTETAAPVQLLNVQIDGVWMQFPKGHPRHRGLQPGRQIHSALLLSPEALLSGQLPHVPYRNGHAEDGAGPQTDPRRGWQAGDRLDSAAANLLRAGRRRGDGRPHRFADGARNAARG